VAAREGMQTLPIIDKLEAAPASGIDARRIEMLTRITDLFVSGAARASPRRRPACSTM
jgi:hypothetical protein